MRPWGWSILWFCGGCAGEPITVGDPPEETVDEELRVRELLGIPGHLQVPYVPSYNPLTAEKIELGRHLFYDRRLSGNETTACADCHLQELGFADGEVTPEGATGDVLVRNSSGLANVGYAGTLTWAHPGLVDMEDQILVPLTGELPVELGINDGNRSEVLARFDADPVYVELFEAAFPESTSGATLDKVAWSLASFCRSMISGGSPYDRYLAGDREALTEQQRLGLSLFNGETFECFHCHGGVNLTTSYRDWGSGDRAQTPFFNTGLYNVDGEGGFPLYDQGLYDVTLDPDHRGFFRPQSLRNVAITAPYMHDGSIPTLREVLEHYMRGGRRIDDGPHAGDGQLSPLKSGLVRPFEATEEEVEAVLAFLEALTDPAFLSDPRFGPP